MCEDTVRRILTEDLELGVRQAKKEEAGESFALRDEQFQHIARRRKWYQRRGWPVLEGEGGVLWLCGLRMDERGKVTEGTRRVWVVTIAPLPSGLTELSL